MATQLEQEKNPLSPQEEALRQVDSYIEEVEKRAEKMPADQGGVRPAPSATQPPKTVYDDFGKVVMISAQTKKPKIVLPLDEEEVREGLHHKLFDAFRWMAESCLYLIKKYPGRVFYRADKS